MTGPEWVNDFCKAHDLDWTKLTAGDRFKITMLVPCAIRCFRVGEAVDVRPGDVCPECEHRQDLQTSWEKIPLEIDG